VSVHWWRHAGTLSRVEGVPIVAAGAEPFVLFAGRPAAERTSDAWAGWIVAILWLKLAIQNHGRFGVIRGCP